MEKLGSRNSTNFQKHLYEIFKKIKHTADDPLKYHQLLLEKYVINYPECRGILMYHEMGTGKTINSINIAENLIQDGWKIIILSSKSLHQNYIDNIKKFLNLKQHDIENIEDHIKQNYSFVSINASNALEQLKEAAILDKEFDIFDVDEDTIEQPLENVVLIVDEAHNLFNSIVNLSKNGLGIYKLIMKSQKIKLLFLTGRPIINNPFELVSCFNMLAQSRTSKTLFGESYKDFVQYFISPKNRIKNPIKFQNRIFGLVSYYEASEEEKKKTFPIKKPTKIERIPMSIKQYAAYASARDKEIDESARRFRRSKTIPPMGKPKGAGSSYRIRSRQFSNFIYPEYATELVNQKTKQYPDKLKDDDLTKKLSVYSPKLAKLLGNIEKHRKGSAAGIGYIYSQFLDFGINIIAKALDAQGYIPITGIEDVLERRISNSNRQAKTYAIISGEVDPKIRGKLIEIFNADINKRGQVLFLLLITITGAEGIDLKNVRHVHIFEPYWHIALIDQILARSIRFNSHIALPTIDRNVQPYIYLSDYPTDLTKANSISLLRKEKTTDIELYESAQANQMLINSFLIALKEVSIDCLLHSDQNFIQRCRICSPTGEQLFLEDLSKDMKVSSPCQPLQEKKIKVKEIIITIDNENKKFYYKIDPKPFQIIHLFEYKPELDSYIEIFPGHPYYEDIQTAVQEREKV